MNTEQKDYLVVGMMSGTSLDGLDIAAVRFYKGEDMKWRFNIEGAETIQYDSSMLNALIKSPLISGEELTKLDIRYGKWLGKVAKRFLDVRKIQPLLIASHGHTVFHDPDNGFTLQIGYGGAIAKELSIIVVNDFRSSDLQLGGQGAPLVPVGDRDLFGAYSSCINLGGFSNYSYQNMNKRYAYDISPANIVINHFAGKLGHIMDDSGQLAAKGCIDNTLLTNLNRLDYYNQTGPKSLSREWVEKSFLPIIPETTDTIDVLRTLTEHIAFQISRALSNVEQGDVLVTGGGAHNHFLIDRMKALSLKHNLVVPETEIIDFKEAIVFAWLGLLRLFEQPNILASVTGAEKDHCAGVIWK